MTYEELESLKLPVTVEVHSTLGMLGGLEDKLVSLVDIHYEQTATPTAIIEVGGHSERISFEHLHINKYHTKVASDNNGGSTDYYKFDPEWVECGDVIEAREMNYNQGNIFKSSFCFNVGRHSGTDYERELNKVIYFAQRELERVSNV